MEQNDFYLRTEDIPAEELAKLFVETGKDREIIDRIKARTPIVLVGSRGVGKSFLLRIAEHELSATFQQDRVLPVYVTFNKSPLLATNDPLQFQHYMLARICSRFARALTKHGLLLNQSTSISILGDPNSSPQHGQQMEEISKAYEQSYQSPGVSVDHSAIPSVEALRDAIEDICASLEIQRVVLLLDEAAHVFYPEQQRQFFTLFRDLRTPYLTCNAAVYPGVTAYGESFQPVHDAAFLTVDRDIQDPSYVAQMLQIVQRQAGSALLTEIARAGQNFATLAYAANGNPRLLLKTVVKAPRMNSAQVNEVIKQFYRIDLWSEHSGLADKYDGHLALVDWGRTFVEETILPDLKRKNDQTPRDENTTCYFWIHRDAPEVVREALRILEYTGVVREHTRGIRATRSGIGTRYAVNLGCMFALEAAPVSTGFELAKRLSPRRFIEYGENYSEYQRLVELLPAIIEPDSVEVLKRQLSRPVSLLEISDWQKTALTKIGINSIADVLSADEAGLQAIKYVGEKRARRMMNAALAAVLEYVSG